MSDQDFVFALDVSADGGSDQMLSELTHTVLRQIGYPAEAIDALAGELRTAVAGRHSDGTRVDVRFRSSAGQLEIVVSGAGGADWRTTRALPAS